MIAVWLRDNEPVARHEERVMQEPAAATAQQSLSSETKLVRGQTFTQTAEHFQIWVILITDLPIVIKCISVYVFA